MAERSRPAGAPPKVKRQAPGGGINTADMISILDPHLNKVVEFCRRCGVIAQEIADDLEVALEKPRLIARDLNGGVKHTQ